ncbi:hypothetical protein Goari_021318 [Gossypium aridum]|uniref:Uncharacterized protein n=1 Tax=Gossypium aridum TaxID=34290 RepID=A0A7J8YDY0_GOSAI|nr:hypothetical protein [Gossypium aridum]
MKDYACCIDWTKDVMRVLDRKAAADFFTTEKPPYGFVKVNFNATVTPNRTGYGMIGNDKDGFLLLEGVGVLKRKL